MDLRFKSITCTFFLLLCFRILSTMQDLLFFLSHPHSVTLLPQVCAGSHILCSFHFSSHFTPASAILLPLYPSTVCWEYIVYFYISISISVYLYYIFLYNLTSLHSPPHGSLCTLFAPHAMSISCHLTRLSHLPLPISLSTLQKGQWLIIILLLACFKQIHANIRRLPYHRLI